MTTSTRSLQELTRSTIQLLCREIGVINTARFLSQFTVGHGNYAEEHDQLIGHWTVDDIVADIHRRLTFTQVE